MGSSMENLSRANSSKISSQHEVPKSSPQQEVPKSQDSSSIQANGIAKAFAFLDTLEFCPLRGRHKTKKKEKISKEPCLKNLGKIEKLFLTFKSKIFPHAKSYLEKRKAEHDQLIIRNVSERIKQSAEAIQEHRGLKRTQDLNPVELMKIDDNLFINEEDLKGNYESHEIAATLAAKKLMYEAKSHGGCVEEIEIDNLGILEAYSFTQKGMKKGEITPTSFALGSDEGRAEDHLTNIYVIHIGNQRAVIRSGKIDSEQRAQDFVALINDIRNKYVEEKNDSSLNLRIVSQQLNSFEGESEIIDGQHRRIAQVNKQLKGEAEVIHINTPSSRWYHFTRSFDLLGIGNLVRKIAPKNFFQGEKLSKEQNLESWGIYSKWITDDVNATLTDNVITTLSASNRLKIHEILNRLENEKEKLGQSKAHADDLVEEIAKIKEGLKSKDLGKAIPKKVQKGLVNEKGLSLYDYNFFLEAERAALKGALTQQHKDYSQLEALLSKIENPSEEVINAFQTVSLMRQVLGSQLGIEGQILHRGKEGMAIQLLNERLGIISALNCKSGLDRTGLWHAVKMSMLSLETKIGAGRIFDLVNDWDKTTGLMNKLTIALGKDKYLGEWLSEDLEEWKNKFGSLIPDDSEKFTKLREQIGDVMELRKSVLNNLIKIGIPITVASTGMMGMKWNSGFQENLIPLNFLPSHIEKSGQTLPLVKINKEGKITGISKTGRTLITKFHNLRGS